MRKVVSRILERLPGTERRALIGSFIIGVVAFLGVASCYVAQVRNEPNFPPVEIRKEAPLVRVALVHGARNVPIEIRGEFTIKAEAEGKFETVVEEGYLEPSPLGVWKEGLTLGRFRFRSNHITIEPVTTGDIIVNKTAYRGNLEIWRDKKGALIVNVLDLESYLAGVLGCEMPLSWRSSALEAQAIAARTYALFQVKTGSRGKYDLETDTRSQVYRGMEKENPVARRIIASTAGVIITYQWRIFQTFFHSTCGGSTISGVGVFNSPEIAPLSGVRCGYCRTSKYFRWNASIPVDEVAKKLKTSKLPRGQVAVTSPISDIRVIPGPNGRAASVAIQHAGGQTMVPGTTFRMAIGASKVRSTSFDLALYKEKIEIRGKGWGHGVGLCQSGAQQMARAGYNAIQILSHYYPGSELVRIY